MLVLAFLKEGEPSRANLPQRLASKSRQFFAVSEDIHLLHHADLASCRDVDRAHAAFAHF